MSINVELPDTVLDALAERVLLKLREGGYLSAPKPWLTMEEAIEESGVSEWEIRKRIKAGTIQTHQPNPGKPPLRINRLSLLRSMESMVKSRTRKEA